MNIFKGLKFTVLVIVMWFVVNLSLTYAEQKLIEAYGYSVMGDGPEENPAVAKERARNAARRNAGEMAGVFVESLTEVKSGRISKDEIRTISANVLNVKSDPVTAEVLEGIAVKYTCHITVVVDTSNVLSQLRLSREKMEEAVRSNKQQEAQDAHNDAELAKLKEQYKNASEPERRKINEQVKRNEEVFTALQMHAKGLESYNNGDNKGAIQFYRKAIELDTNYAAPWNGLGWIYNDEGNYDAAIESFNKAVNIDSNSASAWNGLGCAYNYKHEYNKAIEYCNRAVNLDSTYAAPWNNLGYAYDELQQYDRAIQHYNKATILDPKDAAPWNNLGSIYDELGDFNRAIEYFNKAIEINPEYAKAWNGLGYTLTKLGRYDDAINACQKSTEIDPKYAAAWNGLGYAYNYTAKYDKAVKCFNRAIKLDAKYANAWNGLGYAYAGLGNIQKSYDAYKKAVSIDPNVEVYKKNFETAKSRLNK